MGEREETEMSICFHLQSAPKHQGWNKYVLVSFKLCFLKIPGSFENAEEMVYVDLRLRLQNMRPVTKRKECED